MGGGDGKWDGGKGKKRRKHAFKVLAPDNLITSIMGTKDSSKDSMEEETGCKIVFSQRDEFYPGTYFRTLCIYSDEPEPIGTVIESIIDHVVQCGDHEGPVDPKRPEGDFIGKEDGTYVFRVAVSVQMSGAIIGSKGSNIQAIRDECNVKVFIDKQICAGHQMVKVLGAPEGLRIALMRINESVQAEAGCEEFIHWAAVRAFHEDYAEPGWESWDPVRNQGKGKEGGKEKGGVPPHYRAADPHGGCGKESAARSRSPRGKARWDETSEWQDSQERWTSKEKKTIADFGSMLQALAATCTEFPDDSLADHCSLYCELPSRKVMALIGKRGEHIKGVKRTTGATIRFEEVQGSRDGQQSMLIQGPALRVYKAHALMMKKYHEDDKGTAAKASEEEVPTVEKLQEQLEDLQRQMQLIQSTQAATKGKGKGKKG